ncbi:MAG: SPOR domain-containing protein [bacterium]|nr:SPOR domain-containing protein [bacterium]
MKKSTILLLFIILPLFSCSLGRIGGKPDSEKNKPGTGSYDESFDPSTLDDDTFRVIPPNQTGNSGTNSQPVVVPKTTRRADSAEETVQGYRVQLAATTDEIRARDLKKEAMLKLKEKIYLVFESPNYKVRVGDCRTFDEARLLKQEVIASGFTDAWIVKTNVVAQSESGE